MPGAEFVALADLLRPPAAIPKSAEAIVVEEPSRDEVVEANITTDAIAAAREARLFRARLADAFADASARLVRELASAVLARELRLAPCDLAALTRDVLERAPVVRLRVAAEDAGRDYGIETIVDPSLCEGDAIYELHGGVIDARLGVRLAVILEEMR